MPSNVAETKKEQQRGLEKLRVGWTYPARNPIYRSKSMKNPSCTRTLPGPVRPVGPCRAGHSASTDQTAWSDRLVPILAVNNKVPENYKPVLKETKIPLPVCRRTTSCAYCLF